MSSMVPFRASALALLAASTLLVACSSAPREANASRKCSVAADDPVLAASPQPLFRDCDVDVRAVPQDTRVNSMASRAVPLQSGCIFAEVELVVDTEGRPEPASIRIVRTNDPALASDVQGAARSWRYSPAMKDGQPVRQLVRSMRAIAVSTTRVTAGTVPSSASMSNRTPARNACPVR